MYIYLLFSQTIDYFMVKNLLLLWILQLFYFAFPADLYQWITVSSRIHISLFILQCFSAFTQFVWLWRFIISLVLYPDTDLLLALIQEHVLWFIIHPCHQQQPGALWNIRTLPKFRCFQEDASLQIRTINVVQHPTVTFCSHVLIFSNFCHDKTLQRQLNNI